MADERLKRGLSAGLGTRQHRVARVRPGAQPSLEALVSHRYGPCSGRVRWLSRERVVESPGMSSVERRVAVDAARAAGRLLRDELAGVRRIAYKGAPTNLVTEMDQRAEAEILGRLRGAFPEDAILSEETGASAGRSGRRWIG